MMDMTPESAPLFINFSNHPFSAWSEEQLAAARSCGDLVDMAFPAVDPRWGAAEVAEEAERIVRDIREAAPVPEATAVHVMGEMTLTFALVSRLRALGYRCLASTTERHVWTDGEGNRVTAFRFVRFREY